MTSTHTKVRLYYHGQHDRTVSNPLFLNLDMWDHQSINSLKKDLPMEQTPTPSRQVIPKSCVLLKAKAAMLFFWQNLDMRFLELILPLL